MSSPKHHIDKIEVNGEILKKYHAGELTADQMHAVEKQLLEDEFASDAYEGLSQLSKAEWVEDINALQAALQRRTHSGSGSKSLWPRTLKIAAALALLMISTFLVMDRWPTTNQQKTVVQNDTKDPVADGEKLKAEDKGTSGVVDSMKESAQDLLALENAQVDERAPQQPERSVVGTRDESAVVEKKEEIQPARIAAPQDTQELLAIREELSKDARKQAKNTDDLAQKPLVDVSLSEAEKSADDEASPPAKADAKVRKSDSGIRIRGLTTLDVPYSSISGKVFDEQGTPVPGVNIVLKGTTRGTVSDAEGNYYLPIPEAGGEIMVAMIGFETQEITVQPQTTVDVQLNTDVKALSEIVIVGQAVERERSMTASVEYAKAAPFSGKKAFNNYVSTNLKYPQTAREAGIEGKVVVSFTVLPNGQLTNLKVKKSLGYGCDEEAIRLIRQGPAWKPATKNGSPMEDKIKVKVSFDLDR